MKATIVAGLVVAGLVLAGPASANADLAKSSGCLKCHDVDKKKMGPGFKDVAAAHKGKADEAAVVAKIMGGKDHPPVKASEADVKTLVKWVLAM
jgi:cytochrome c